MLYHPVMMKMVKDTMVTALVVGAFLVGACGMVDEVRSLWPSPEAEVIAMSATPDAPAAVTYHITAPSQ
jgi:hypothetical protein